jgi:KTSC domain
MTDEPDTFPLSSTMLSEGTYDEKTGDLTLTFANGRQYPYRGVPKEIVERLKTAVSPGHFYRDNIAGRFS